MELVKAVVEAFKNSSRLIFLRACDLIEPEIMIAFQAGVSYPATLPTESGYPYSPKP